MVNRLDLEPGTLLRDENSDEWGIVLERVDGSRALEWGHTLDEIELFYLKSEPAWWVRWYDPELDTVDIAYVTQEDLDMGAWNIEGPQ
jgi:hypothetical protein